MNGSASRDQPRAARIFSIVSIACTRADTRDFFIDERHTKGMGRIVIGRYHIQVWIESPIKRSYHAKLNMNESVSGNPGQTVRTSTTANTIGSLGRIFKSNPTA